MRAPAAFLLNYFLCKGLSIRPYISSVTARAKAMEKAYTNFRTLPLTEKGRAQSESVAKRLGSIPVDVVISSPMQRTKETAIIIAKHTGHDIVYSEPIPGSGLPRDHGEE